MSVRRGGSATAGEIACSHSLDEDLAFAPVLLPLGRVGSEVMLLPFLTVGGWDVASEAEALATEIRGFDGGLA